MPDQRVDGDGYNFSHFKRKHFIEDFRMTFQQIVEPGSLAADFTLPKVGGGVLRLSDLQGMPVLLRFGSFT